VFNVAGPPDVIHTYGSPDFQADEPPIDTGGPNAPPYRIIGYSCSTRSASGLTDLIPVGTVSNGSTQACLAAFYINLNTGRLVAFQTTDPKFHTTSGASPGMSTAEASRKEGLPAMAGCNDGIDEQTSGADMILPVIGTHPGSGQAGTVVGGTVQSISLEATRGRIGLQFC
jgi:hypothetical protein